MPLPPKDERSLLEYEMEYKLQYPGFEPHVWAAMAYHAKGMTFEVVQALLAERFGPELKAKRDAIIQEALEVGRQDPESASPVFEIEEITEALENNLGTK